MRVVTVTFANSKRIMDENARRKSFLIQVMGSNPIFISPANFNVASSKGIRLEANGGQFTSSTLEDSADFVRSAFHGIANTADTDVIVEETIE